MRQLTRIFVTVLFAAGISSATLAQTGAAGAQSVARGYRVAGTVVNSATGEPVRGAAVALLTVADSQAVASTESRDDGSFAMDGLSAAKYQLIASKRGFSTGYYNQHFDYNSAIVTGPNQQTDKLIFKLAPSGAIAGVVTADGGDAVEGAAVLLFEKPHRHLPGEGIEQVQNVQTDDTGAYEFAGLEPGDYLIAVKSQPWYAMHRDAPDARTQPTEQEAALDVAYPITYFDSTTDESSASPITVAMGARVTADVTLHAVPALHLSMQAARRPNGGISRVELIQTVFGKEVEGEGGGDVSRGQTSVDFAGVAPGHYQVTQGDPPRFVEVDATTSQQVDPSAGVPTQKISGTVQTADGQPYTGRGVVVLEPAEGGGPAVMTSPIGQGTFSFVDVPVGSWQIEVVAEAQIPVLAIGPRGGKAQAGNRVTVEDKPLTLVVTVSAGNTRLEGFALKNGRGLAGAMVILIPKDLSAIAELARRDQSDSDGSFALLNVAPGDYTLVAIENAWDIDWFDPAVISRFLPHGISVTVKSTSDKTQHLASPIEVQGMGTDGRE
jgi:hypothetical protein